MKDDTLLTHAGRDPQANFGIVNPPVYHASTILFPTLDAFRNFATARVRYGRRGTPTSYSLEEAVAALEGCHGAVTVPSGIAAITAALTTLTAAGDHILVADSVYLPTRNFCDAVLKRFGVETEYYDPCIGGGIAGLIRPNTRVVYAESPGSLTFEVQDLPAIAKAAHASDALVVFDNTWGAGYFHKPAALGADIVIHACTKYVVGHSDVMSGLVACRDEKLYRDVRNGIQLAGHCAGPDDVYLALRGLRSMGVRLQRHQESGLAVARWLASRKEVTRIMHPALEDDPGHALWRRDFTGACGLFGLVLDCTDQAALAAMLDGMKLFGMGYSWGGFESLLIPTEPNRARSATKWTEPGQTMRIHVGLEDPDDLIADLEAGFERMRKAG